MPQPHTHTCKHTHTYVQTSPLSTGVADTRHHEQTHEWTGATVRSHHRACALWSENIQKAYHACSMTLCVCARSCVCVCLCVCVSSPQVRMVVSGAYVGVPRGPQPLTYDSLMNKSTTNMAITTADATHTGSVGAVPPPARVLYHPTCGHADWLLNTTWQVGQPS